MDESMSIKMIWASKHDKTCSHECVEAPNGTGIDRSMLWEIVMTLRSAFLHIELRRQVAVETRKIPYLAEKSSYDAVHVFFSLYPQKSMFSTFSGERCS